MVRPLTATASSCCVEAPSFVLCSSSSLSVAIKRYVSAKKPWIVAGCVRVGWWVGCYCVRTTSPTNKISLFTTALAVLPLFLCSSISPRIAVAVRRCVSAKKPRVVAWREWVGWRVSGLLAGAYNTHKKFPALSCASAQKPYTPEYCGGWVSTQGWGVQYTYVNWCKLQTTQAQKIINPKTMRTTTSPASNPYSIVKPCASAQKLGLQWVGACADGWGRV